MQSSKGNIDNQCVPRRTPWESKPSKQISTLVRIPSEPPHTTELWNDSYTARIKLRSNNLTWTTCWYTCIPCRKSSIDTRIGPRPILSNNRLYTLTYIDNLGTWLSLSQNITPWVPIFLCALFPNFCQLNSFTNQQVQPFVLLSFHQDLMVAYDFYGSTSNKILAPNGVHPAKW